LFYAFYLIEAMVMSVKKPLISVGIPTYNRPSGLRRILGEITSQTYTNLEILVSDNHSPEAETGQIVREFMQNDDRIQYFRQAQNIGSFNNYGFLFEQAQGEYFMWVCDDDFRRPEYIEACIREFDRLKSPILVNSYSTRLDAQSGQVMARDQGCTTMGLAARDRYVKYVSTIFTKQAAIGDVLYGLIKRESLHKAMQNRVNIIAWDHPLLADLALDGEFYTIPLELMSASDCGISADLGQTAKAQLIAGSLSEKMPFWVKEKYLQRAIRASPNLSRLEKGDLAIWSYRHYFVTQGFKMWVKGVAPVGFRLLKKWFNPDRSVASGRPIA
jgi:glycosyltransferase involved in cell wall biosynthesis